ncbi:MAG: TIGR04283 family arsenosugar biosynthesis glycosyltransferase [Desulfovibrionales bacterium]|nr:TIGR04283 family arsenosugar biosynthesis glycosyltransferase [Desulfovibrionales bacterium]
MRISFSVIIPVWFEASHIARQIEHVFTRAAESDADVEIIVADGDPQQSTLAVIQDTRVIPVAAPQGRAVQMNAGAQAASKDILVFLHADTTLPPRAFALIADAFQSHGSAKAGAFALRIASSSPFLYGIAKLANWRNSLTRTPYGDQAQFFYRTYFEALGGFEPIPIMEDVAIMRLIRKRGDGLAMVETPVVTSARRWAAEGIFRCTLRNLVLRFLYGAGVSAHTLSNWYRAMKG